MKSNPTTALLVIGWREWAALPDLGVPAIQMKVDTGAKTSVLHAEDIRVFEIKGKKRVEFSVFPRQGHTDPKVKCVADVVDQRIVSDSGGHRELRYVIRTQLSLGGKIYDIDLTLTNRNKMKFRMLLGRSAIRGNFAVDVSKYSQLGTLRSINRPQK